MTGDEVAVCHHPDETATSSPVIHQDDDKQLLHLLSYIRMMTNSYFISQEMK
jgi:hypothetical protein